MRQTSSCFKYAHEYRKKVKLVDVLPNWWGDKRYHNK